MTLQGIFKHIRQATAPTGNRTDAGGSLRHRGFSISSLFLAQPLLFSL